MYLSSSMRSDFSTMAASWALATSASRLLASSASLSRLRATAAWLSNSLCSECSSASCRSFSDRTVASWCSLALRFQSKFCIMYMYL